jgi:hypothetical protein
MPIVTEGRILRERLLKLLGIWRMPANPFTVKLRPLTSIYSQFI